MRRLLAVSVALVIAGSSAAMAQTVSMADMGATSPLGTMNFNAPSGPLGIPLGSTELDVGGTSPLPDIAQCTGGAMSDVSSAASAGAFDGGGTSTDSSMGGTNIGGGNSADSFDGGGAPLGSNVAGSCSTTGAAASSALANTPATGLQGFGSVTNTTIPLGSVEIANSGVSPLVGVAGPTITTPCGGASTSTGTMSELRLLKDSDGSHAQ
jgi:hypothetical protein